MKNVSKLLTIIFIIGTFFTACEKEQLKEVVLEETPAPDIFFKNDYLSFNSIDVYDKTLTDLSLDKTIINLNQLNENPLSNLKKSGDLNEELYDDFLLSILNENEIVQIGQWIIKVDMRNEIVSVISEENINYYEDLIENIDNDSIYKFSTEDEVLDLLELGVKGTVSSNLKKIPWWKRCRDRKVSARQDGNGGGGIPGREQKVRYFRAGIYFSLYAKANLKNRWGNEPLRIDIYGSYKFEDRCDRSYSRTWRSGYNAGLITKGGKVVLKVYQHRKTLRQYKLEARFKTTWVDRDPVIIENSRTYRISDGY